MRRKSGEVFASRHKANGHFLRFLGQNWISLAGDRLIHNIIQYTVLSVDLRSRAEGVDIARPLDNVIVGLRQIISRYPVILPPAPALP